MATNPETKRTEVIPFEFDANSKSFIARVIISKDPELIARVVNKIMEKVDKHQNWRWFAGNYLTGCNAAGGGVWRTSLALAIGVKGSNIMKQI